jgi:cytochrome P450
MDFVSCTLVLLITYLSIQTFSLLLRRITKPNYKLPPGPTPLPIIGNLLALGQKPHNSLAKLAKIHGPLMSLKFGQITTIVISSATMAKEVLLTNDKFLSNRNIPQTVSVVNHEQYSLAFMPISPLWKELRKICNTQLLSHKSLDSSQDVRRNKIQQLLNDIQQSSQIGEAIDIGTIVFKTTINLLSNTVFSMDLIHSNGAAEEFKDVVTNITKLAGTPNVADFFSALKMLDPQGLKRRQTKNVRKVLDIFGDLINQRLKMREGTCADTNKDMLDAMLNISKDNEFMDTNIIQHLSHVCIIFILSLLPILILNLNYEFMIYSKVHLTNVNCVFLYIGYICRGNRYNNIYTRMGNDRAYPQSRSYAKSQERVGTNNWFRCST